MKKELKEIINSTYFGDDTIFRKDGTIRVKEYYFYPHGRDEEKLAEKIKQELEKKNVAVTILEKSNHYNSWPKSSWFEVIFLPQLR